MSQEQRLAIANQIVDLISRHGRQFFYSAEYDRISRFDLDAHEQLWYIDHHTGLRVCPTIGGAWPGFTHGAVARELVEHLARFIVAGELIPAAQFQKEWGYGTDMARVRKAVYLTNAVQAETAA